MPGGGLRVHCANRPPNGAVTPESLQSNLGRRGIGMPVGILRRHSDTQPHTAADAPKSLRSCLGRGGIGTPRGGLRVHCTTAPPTPTQRRLHPSPSGPTWAAGG